MPPVSMIKLTAPIVLAMFSFAPVAAQQTSTPAKEGTLSNYINHDAADTATKLTDIQQEIFADQQQNVRIEFMLKYGSKIKLDFVQFPSGADLVPGYVFTPVDMDETVRHPVLELVHGGFHERLNVEWFPLIEGLIKRGYVVIFPEYHGSRGYGLNLYKNDYGTSDTADVLAMADYAASKPFVDPNRMGIMGESRGGMTALLAIEKAPTKFKVAVDVVGLTDFLAYMAYKPDYRRDEVAQEHTFGGKLPHDNLAAYMAASPLNDVDKIQTPLLVMATTGDTIAPIELHTGRLLDALKARGKIFQSKIYDHAAGGHIFLHGDQPDRDDAYARIYAWLGTYLKP